MKRKAGESIPFGSPIRVDSAKKWVLANHSDMQAVASRPKWANRTRNQPGSLESAYSPGQVVETVTDGSILMIFAEMGTIRGGIVVLAGDTAHVRLKSGKIDE